MVSKLKSPPPKHRKFGLLAGITLFLALVATSSHSADFSVGCDVDELIATIELANANDEPDTVTLTAGCNYTLNAADNTSVTDGPNGLPVITSLMRLASTGLPAMITRAGDAPAFRLFEVSALGTLILDNLILDNGRTVDAQDGITPSGTGFFSAPSGGAVLSKGGALILNSIVKNNRTGRGISIEGSPSDGGNGGAISCVDVGSVTIERSWFDNNQTGTSLDTDGSPGAGGTFNVNCDQFNVARSSITNSKIGEWPSSERNTIAPYIALVFPTNSFSSSDSTYSANGLNLQSNMPASPGFFANGSATIDFSRNTFVNNGTGTASVIRIDDAADGGLIVAKNLFEDNPADCDANLIDINTEQSTFNMTDRAEGICGLPANTNNNTVSQDDKVLPLADNAGIAPTHDLTATSPALDQISPVDGVLDQRGVYRGQDKNPNPAQKLFLQDIGAIESTVFGPIEGNVTNERGQFDNTYEDDWFSLSLKQNEQLTINVQSDDLADSLSLSLHKKRDLFTEIVNTSYLGDGQYEVDYTADETTEYLILIYGFAIPLAYTYSVEINEVEQTCFPVKAGSGKFAVVCL